MTKTFSLLVSRTSFKTIAIECAAPVNFLTGDVTVCHEFGRESGLHRAVLATDETHICAVEATEISCSSDGIDERAERDSKSIKNCGLAAAVLGYEHCELLMQFDRALGETPEVSQVQAVDAQESVESHSPPAR